MSSSLEAARPASRRRSCSVAAAAASSSSTPASRGTAWPARSTATSPGTARRRPGVAAALAMLAWSADVALLTDGRPLTAGDRQRCDAQGVAVRDDRVARLEGRDGRLERIVFVDGSSLPRVGMFLVAGQREQSKLPAQIGCEINADGVVVTDEHDVTSVPGIYAAGDASVGEQMVVVAAAQGTVAAVKIHASLWEEDLRARVRSV